MFAASPGTPKLMTGDSAMIDRLYHRYGPGLTTKLPKQKQGQSVSQVIAQEHPNGYDAVIPDGLGATRTITVVPMVN